MPHCATSRCCHASRSDVFAPAHLGELTGVVPPEMVDAALEAGGGRERRLRRLPSRVVVYLLLAGALFLSLADWVARLVVLPAELPIGIVTALLGAPVLFMLIRRETRS